MKTIQIALLIGLTFTTIQAALPEVDNEYCSLNFSIEACTQKTLNQDCVWMDFEHNANWAVPKIKSCFEMRYMINALKYIAWPDDFTNKTDKELCTELGTECEEITKKNFKTVYSNVVSKAYTKIAKVNEIVVHTSDL